MNLVQFSQIGGLGVYHEPGEWRCSGNSTEDTRRVGASGGSARNSGS